RIDFRREVTIPAGTTLALSHHPWLEVSSGDRPIPSSADAEHRLRLTATAPRVRSLLIAYRRPAVAVAAQVVSAIGALFTLLVLARGRAGTPRLISRAA